MSPVPCSSRPRSFSFRNTLQAFLVDDNLAFAELLSKEHIERVFLRHGSLHGGIFHTAIVLWAFLSQVLRDGKEASCQSAVARIGAFLARFGNRVPHSNTGDYCKARATLSAGAIHELSCDVAKLQQREASRDWKWKGKNTYLVDGFTFQMPDTPKNQKAYPQHSAQKPGLGFPIARVVAVISLSTAMVVDATISQFKGKSTGEISLFRRLFGKFQEGDVVVADRHYCSYWMICELVAKGVHVCFRKHQSRHTDFRKGKRLAKRDHIVQWQKGVRPAWMTKEEYAKHPKSITLREIGYTITKPGRKQQPFVIVTTLLDDQGEDGVSHMDLATLYGFRWNVELDIRSIKSNMNLGFLRCKSPEMIYREFWVTLLAYNLIRATIAESAQANQKQPRQISFTSTCVFVLSNWQEYTLATKTPERTELYRKMLQAISQCEVQNREGRFEPRVVKRRKDQYTLMMEPRNSLRQRLSRGDNSFE